MVPKGPRALQPMARRGRKLGESFFRTNSGRRRLSNRAMILTFCLTGVLGAVSGGLGLAGQDVDSVPVADPAEWTGSAEFGSNLYWGSRSQSFVTTDGMIQRATDLFTVKVDASFTYGQADDSDGTSVLSKRSWEFEVNTDYQPNQPLRTYLVGSLAASYEKRYDSRWNLGIGGKYSYSRERGRKIEVRFAVELEKTSPSSRAKRRDGDDDIRGRWSTTLDIDRNLIEDRLRFTSKTDWKPQYDRLDRFTATSKNTFSLAVTETVDFKVSLIESYDSESVDRGADQNSDGRLIFSVAARFR